MEHIEDYIKKELKGLDLTSEDEALDVISDVYIVSLIRKAAAVGHRDIIFCFIDAAICRFNPELQFIIIA